MGRTAALVTDCKGAGVGSLPLVVLAREDLADHPGARQALGLTSIHNILPRNAFRNV